MMNFFDWYAMAKEISDEDPLFILVPLLLILFWFIARRSYRGAAMLFLAILLEVFTIPHVISFVSQLMGKPGLFGLRFPSFTVYEGLVCFPVGILMILETVMTAQQRF